ncbi:MAG: ABC transporter permease [Dehalococcoidia bacterium]
MNWRSIEVLVFKDLVLFFRNRFFAVITALGLVMYVVIYFVMPSTVAETLEIGLYAPVVPPALEVMQAAEGGFEIYEVESEETLKEGVIQGDYMAGLAFPADIMERFNQGQPPEIKLYVASDSPDEMMDIVSLLVTEMAYLETGQFLSIDWQQEILGPDMAGSQIPLRDRMRSLFVVVILMTETFGLASLISEEAERRTAHALLATPMTVRDLFIAKGIVGILLAFVQAVVFIAIVGGISEQPLIVLTALFLGAMLVTGVGFLVASLGKDFVSIIAWSIPALVVLIIPAVGIIMPGAASDWIRAIPSYYLADTIYRVSNFGAGWTDVWLNLLILAAFNLVIISGGILALRRKLQ